MSTRVPLGSEAPWPVEQARTGNLAKHDLRELIAFATRGLAGMLDPSEQLFCHRLVRANSGLVREGISRRYSIMTLLGLRELKSIGSDCPYDLPAMYAALKNNIAWIKGVGDLGLMIWLTASFEPDGLEELLRTFNCETALERFPDAREGRTMELAWFLTGLAHAAEASPKLLSTVTDVCVETYHRLEENQGEFGLFGHMGAKSSLVGRLRGHIGSFADQVYPMYAMSKFASVLHVEDPLGPALECATAICSAQGDLGQWWWLYDTKNGKVSSRYPVYSVHQHGMAPMGLFAVEEATGQCFDEFVYKGLNWIYGANELGVDMRDSAENLIWRCQLLVHKQAKYWEMALSVVRPPNEDTPSRPLRVLFEERPYEFGWLLFAFAKRSIS